MAELFRFRSDGTTWRYTGSRIDETVIQGETWTAAAIDRSRWDRKLDDLEITLTMPDDLAPASLFLLSNPSGLLWVDVYDLAGNIQLIGKVMSAKFDKSREATLEIAVLSPFLSGDIPHQHFGPACPFVLFDSDCALASDAVQGDGPFEVIFDITTATVDDATNTIDATEIGTKADGFFNDGFIRLGFQRARIIKHVGSVITLMRNLRDSSSGNLIVKAGCDKSVGVCESKFANLVNFGGFPFKPTNNPLVSP